MTLIKVDFRPPKDPVESNRVKLESIILRLDWLEHQTRRDSQEHLQLRRRFRELQAELVLERRNQFTDADVLEALEAVAGHEPIAATVIARHLFPNEPTHSGVVRVGLALGRLADDGRVIRVRLTSNRECHWTTAQAAT